MAVTQKNQLFDTGFLFTPSESFWLGRPVLPQYKTSKRQTTDARQTTDRQTDGWMDGMTMANTALTIVTLQCFK